MPANGPPRVGPRVHTGRRRPVHRRMSAEPDVDPLPVPTVVDWEALPVDTFVLMAGSGMTNDVIRAIRSTGIDINSPNGSGDTALHTAAYHGRDQVIRALLSSDAIDANATNGGWTPLHVGCKHARTSVAKALIQYPRTDVNRQGPGGVAPLHVAAENGTALIVQLLLAHPRCSVNLATQYNHTVAEGSETALHMACSNGHRGVVEALLAHRDVFVDRLTSLGWTPLHLAAQYGHAAVVDMLVTDQRGLDVSCENGGWTPLHLACKGGHTDVIQRLLMCPEVEPNEIADDGGRNPLHLAAMHGHPHAARLLVEHEGVDVNVFTRDGLSALHLACHASSPEVVEVLLNCAAVDVRATDNAGNSSLHIAVRTGSVDTVAALLRRSGGTVNAKNVTGDTALHIAGLLGYPDIASVLLRRTDIEPNELNYGWTKAMGDDDEGRVLVVPQENTCGWVDVVVDDATVGQLSVTGVSSRPSYPGYLPPSNLLGDAVGHGHPRVVATPTRQALASPAVWGQVTPRGAPPPPGSVFGGPAVGVPVERPTTYPTHTHEGRAPIHLAAESGHSLTVRTLLQHPQVDPNAKTRGGLRPLHLAAATGQVGVLSVLLEHPTISLSATDQRGATPLHAACWNGQRGAVNALLQCPIVDINAMDGRTGTALHGALMNDNEAVARALLRHGGIDVNLRTPAGGATPLHVACAYGQRSAVERLLMCNADLNITSDDGRWPLGVAVESGRDTTIVKWLTPMNVAGDTREAYRRSVAGEGVHYHPMVTITYRPEPGTDPQVVSVVGEFNHFDTVHPTPMNHFSDQYLGEMWCVVLALAPTTPGQPHPIQFVVDGEVTTQNGQPTVSHGGMVCTAVNVSPVGTAPTSPPRAFHPPPTRVEPVHPRSHLEDPIHAVGSSTTHLHRGDIHHAREGPPALGVEIKLLDDQYGHPECVVVVHGVRPGGPADKAGVKYGDVIQKINGHDVTSKDRFGDILWRYTAGDVISLSVLRDEFEELRMLVTLE